MACSYIERTPQNPSGVIFCDRRYQSRAHCLHAEHHSPTTIVKIQQQQTHEYFITFFIDFFFYMKKGLKHLFKSKKTLEEIHDLGDNII